MQFEFFRDWIPGLGTSFHLGVDGLSMPMVFLTALLSFLATIASKSIAEMPTPLLHAAAHARGRSHRRVRRARPHLVLRVLGGRAHPDVLPDQRLGRTEPRLRRGEVLPLHAGGLARDARRHHHAVPGDRCRELRHDRDPRRGCRARRPASRPPSSSRSPSRSPSRCRCSRSTPGCPTRTSRRPPPSRCCSPACCSRWGPTASCASDRRCYRRGSRRSPTSSPSSRSSRSSTARRSRSCRPTSRSSWRTRRCRTWAT